MINPVTKDDIMKASAILFREPLDEKHIHDLLLHVADSTRCPINYMIKNDYTLRAEEFDKPEPRSSALAVKLDLQGNFVTNVKYMQTGVIGAPFKGYREHPKSNEDYLKIEGLKFDFFGSDQGLEGKLQFLRDIRRLIQAHPSIM